MRTYGRINNPDGSKSWIVVETAPNGDNSEVYLTTLVQVFKLNLGESPFFANYGIPAKQSVLQQIAPDFYIAATQAQFAPFFAALVIAKTENLPIPTYQVNAVTLQGAILTAQVAT